MGFVLVIVFIGGIALVSTLMANARTAARKSSNASVRRSLDVRSALGASELSSLLSTSLAQAGTTPIGSFDNKSFFRLSKGIELEVAVTTEDTGSRARVMLRNVRSTSGRPERLTPVGRVLDATAQIIRERDRSANID